MSSVSAISSVPATSTHSAVSAAAPAADKQTATALSAAGPAATVQLSQAARAKIAGDKDWTPGAHIDSL